MGPLSFFDAVPDEILVRILVLAAKDPSAAEPSALLEELCKEVPWEVVMLDVEEWVGAYEQLLDLLRVCGNARHVRLGQASACRLEVKLSHLLTPFVQLEGLELPSDMPHWLLHEEEVASFHEPLNHLKRLALGFERLDGKFEYFFELLSVAPRLESLQIDLRMVNQGRKVDALVRMLLNLQKRYPSLNIVVNWPNDCMVGAYLFEGI
ncbi:hypothetical protein KFL_004710100 [Klebsormidium nitens]|uniref:Uncharacterized protein n=1 Tax=Klebsormidium nitens TaxID=105231 RepID=A0A1Y1IIM0_KLENI|nr:hypothetical protein KFL_004710100 [Klebsormidium nitens]|eukprot:GAQ88941.1 hypothetical protein KFL_004710100 [Klebsormidium nitens]